MSQLFSLTDFGAKPDTVAIQTEIFQHALDAAREAGGGEVIVPAGHFVIGSIRIYSHTTLRLSAGTHLEASPRIADFTSFGNRTHLAYAQEPFYIKDWHLPADYFHALICAYDAEDIAVIGAPGATIDGCDLRDDDGEEGFRGPMTLVFSAVKNLTLRGYTVVRSANWAHVIDSCENVQIRNIEVRGGHDGFNLHHSHHIELSDCTLRTGDDCLAGYDVHDLTVANTFMNSACNNMRLGGVDLVFINDTFLAPAAYPHRSSGRHDTLNAFMYYSLDKDSGEDGKNVSFSHCTLVGLDQLMYVHFGQQWALQTHYPLRDIRFEDTTITAMHQTAIAMGEGEPLTVTFKNVTITDAPTPFLTTDASATVVLENVDCGKGVTFETANGPRSLSGVVERVTL
ncbi:glycoside hydrolase family 28 protein [Lacticaseibacillus mingshuiensis]|uniref:glycoside hydrolase family 28 protein n=1 Tax=Lacticaseibacillus mingshuiensis TaxID=2799574 RepID=UPI00194FB2C3|nr:glycosyl hydrolase family 28-related protein [Lacticaseibacillus mingshuiensis]